jgi:hypothetical protein
MWRSWRAAQGGFDLLDEIEGRKKVIDFVLKEIAGG